MGRKKAKVEYGFVEHKKQLIEDALVGFRDLARSQSDGSTSPDIRACQENISMAACAMKSLYDLCDMLNYLLDQ